MVSKSGVWGHFGSWDFDRAYMAYILKNNSRDSAISKYMDGFNMTIQEATSVYEEISNQPDETAVNTWISQWPGYASRPAGCSRNSNDSILCPLPQQGEVFVNLTTMDAFVATPAGNVYPNSIVYKANETLAVKEFDGNTLGLSMALMEDSGNYASFFASHITAPSIFTRLFYYDGYGTKYYKKVFDIRDSGNQRIIVWKINWPGSFDDELFQEPEEISQADNVPENNNEEMDKINQTVNESVTVEEVNGT